MGKYSITISETAKIQLTKHYKSGDKALIKRIERIFEELSNHPFIGIGKPEALKHDLAGLWSRRLDEKNRLVYNVVEENITVFVVSAKGHYFDK
ncbi:MAG: Txe/YoeB family addiction module toxin [Bacteroidia bacterium]|nr:Txe/YoeB family addiction module toxin [Bacteroidia bacterium]